MSSSVGDARRRRLMRRVREYGRELTEAHRIIFSELWHVPDHTCSCAVEGGLLCSGCGRHYAEHEHIEAVFVHAPRESEAGRAVCIHCILGLLHVQQVDAPNDISYLATVAYATANASDCHKAWDELNELNRESDGDDGGDDGGGGDS